MDELLEWIKAFKEHPDDNELWPEISEELSDILAPLLNKLTDDETRLKELQTKLEQLEKELRFYQERGSVLVEADIAGLPPENMTGFFALHIHEGGSCSGQDLAETGGHYNPEGKPHPEHAGDLLPLMSFCGGRAYMAVRTDRFCVRDIIGQTAVIHSGPDDFHSQPAGSSGKKIACGLICGR